MKRFLSLLLAAAAVLSLAGCQPGGNGLSESEPGSSAGVSLPESSEPAPAADSDASLPPASSPSEPVSSEPAASEPASSELVSSEETVVKLTFAEGTTLPKMFMMLEEKGVASQDALFEAEKNGDFSDIALVSSIPVSAERCYRLEGYLFPDTYEFYVGEKPESILRKMLQNTSNRLKEQ